MFYEGDLQSGIGKAVQESKFVACFVTDNGEESQLWENDFLQDPTLRSSLSEQAVVLRLEAGSTEAGYLAAIYPLPKTPTFVVIKNGELKQYIAAGVSKDDFLNRLTVVFGSSTPQVTAPSNQTTLSASTNQPPVQAVQQNIPVAPAPNSLTSSSNPSNATVQNALAERSARLEAQRKEQEAKDKAKRAAEAQARKKKLDEAAASGSKPSADMKYALLQKKRQQEARDERARILKRVEDDKAARRVRAAEQKTQAQVKNEPQSSEAGPSNVKPASKKSSAECALQIRLFDGSTIRSRFPSQATLSKDVRKWIDEKQPGDQPYTFKQVLTPLPNKNIETSEEEHSLESLDLAPSATLILLPVTGYSSAYAGGGGIVSTGVGLVSSGIGIAGRVFGGLFGGAAPVREEQHSSATGTGTVNQSAAVNVRTLRDRDRRDEQQFYNGNATNFEPRRDDDSKDD